MATSRRWSWSKGWFGSSDKDRVRRRRRLRSEVLESRHLLSAQPALPTTLISGEELYTFLDSIPESPVEAVSYIRPETFTAFSLNRQMLESALASVPMEFTSEANGSSTILALPHPTEGLHHFEIVEAPIMHPDLAAQFPTIKTYRGQGIDDPTATVRFDVTPLGFHAQVLSPYGSYYIDPYYHLDESVYVTYSREGFELTPELQQLRDDVLRSVAQDFVDDHGAEGEGGDDGDGGVAERSGTQLRTYRAAVAATGEYTTFHGGTVTAGQAAIVTAMNRVNQIYEAEFSIRMTLVANNSLLVFTNAATDPYTNSDGFAMLGQNQTTVDSVIGNANYDIGHVFSTGGGGVAGLGVVGITGQKARGVTGLPAPTGDPFYVDYVAHEMGHQYGAAHTFNGTGGSCGSNRSSSSAYEPGSGSTIMAYSGICGSDNLQNLADPYFHSRSFDQVISLVDNSIPGVGTRTATGNSVPTANAGTNFTIPSRTPFRLTGSGTDANAGDVLTYNWEQRDLGPAQALSAPDNGTSPLFRSRIATTDPVRVFPRLTSILNNTPSLGERLPTTNRTLRFRLTVRDNRSGGGGVNTSDMQISVIESGVAFEVTSPNTGSVVWLGNSIVPITWQVAGTNAGLINTPNVNIKLSTDGGLTFPTMLASSVPNTGSANITVPVVNTTQARIMVEGAGNIFFDISNANFQIIGADVTPPTATGTAPNVTMAGGTSHTITVNYTDNLSLDASSIGPGDIEIVAPDTSVIPATFINKSSSVNAPSISATYSIVPPGGTWDFIDNGNYTIRLLPNEVRDVTGLFAAGGSIGAFTVSVPSPGSSCSNPAPDGVVGDGFTDFFYNPVTGILSYRIDGTNFPSDALTAITIAGPPPSDFPTGSPTWGSADYTSGELRLTLPNDNGVPRLERDLPLVQYATGLTGASFGCSQYVAVGSGSPRTVFTRITIATDTVVPTASSSPTNITTAGGANYSFTVDFGDDQSVQGSDLATGIVRVTGPNSYNQIATLIGRTPPTGNAASIQANFQIPAPGGSWSSAANGTYTIELLPWTVTDLQNNFVVGGNVATFNVAIGTSLPGDFNGDGNLDCADVNALSTAIATASGDLTYDVTNDGLVNSMDLEEWVLNLKGTLFGDANLDLVVDGSDFGIWNSNKFSTPRSWCDGDFNADGVVDGSDFGIWNTNKFQSGDGRPAGLPVGPVTVIRDTRRDEVSPNAEELPGVGPVAVWSVADRRPAGHSLDARGPADSIPAQRTEESRRVRLIDTIFAMGD